MQSKIQKQIYNWAKLHFAGFNNHCNAALRKIALPGRNFAGAHQSQTVVQNIQCNRIQQRKGQFVLKKK